MDMKGGTSAEEQDDSEREGTHPRRDDDIRKVQTEYEREEFSMAR